VPKCACCVGNRRNFFFFSLVLLVPRASPGARSCTTGHHRFMRLSPLLMSKHTHSTLTNTHTDSHSDTDTRRHATRGTLSLSLPFLFFLVSQLAASHRFLVICIGVSREKRGEVYAPLNGQLKEQSSSLRDALLFQTTMSDNFLLFSEIVPSSFAFVVSWPELSRANLTFRNSSRNDKKKKK